MVVNKGESPHCQLKPGEIFIEQLNKLNYLGSSLLTKDRKFDMESESVMIVRNIFMKLWKK